MDVPRLPVFAILAHRSRGFYSLRLGATWIWIGVLPFSATHTDFTKCSDVTRPLAGPGFRAWHRASLRYGRLAPSGINPLRLCSGLGAFYPAYSCDAGMAGFACPEAPRASIPAPAMNLLARESSRRSRYEAGRPQHLKRPYVASIGRGTRFTIPMQAPQPGRRGLAWG